MALFIKEIHMNTRNRTYDWEDPALLASHVNQFTGLEFLEKMAKPNFLSRHCSIPSILNFLRLIQAGQSLFFNRRNSTTILWVLFMEELLRPSWIQLWDVRFIQFFHWASGYTTIDIKVNFLKSISIKTGLMKATGTIINQGNRTALLESRLTDESGKLYAHATSTCMILKIE